MRQLFLFIFLVLSNFLTGQETSLHHQLDVHIEPSSNKILAEDLIQLGSVFDKGEIKFHLNAALKISNHSSNVKIKQLKNDQKIGDFGMDRDDAGESTASLEVNTYQVVFLKKSPDKKEFKITYEGQILSPVVQSEENYQRGFSESPGIIDDQGIYLAGSTYWVPHFEEKLMSFELKSSLPEGWKTVSQGGRTLEEVVKERHIDIWKEQKPQEEVFLIAAKFNEYSFNAGNVKAMAFLRNPDEALANKYLETTAQYLEMYRQLVGPFPYAKFALVENFWETGYGMPSFTLLGEKIIRFPFILHSSYPHELLHNWWGNSVYVDFESGNWCEGLTAYMADHLIKEQRGQGDEYRRTTIQKFADYVTPENDFPVSEFLSRFNASSEAIGYGKVSMIFHMLRQKLGDEEFIRAIQRLNRENAFKVTSWENIQNAFQSVTDTDLAPFFKQWVNRAGAPELALKEVEYQNETVEFSIEQLQQEDPFFIEVPILISTNSTNEFHQLTLDKREQRFTISSKGEAITGIQLDPKFDLFRMLDPNEVPATLSKAYGAKKTVFVLPSKLDETQLKRYTSFIDSWKAGNSGDFEVHTDMAFNVLPNDKTVWVLGYKNKFAQQFMYKLRKQDFEQNAFKLVIQKKDVLKNGTSAILTTKHPENQDEAIVFFNIEKNEAIPGLVRKLPHYGKYSFLAFEGDEPTNIVKGQWDVLDSPLASKKTGSASTASLTAADDRTESFMKRRAMGYLAPVFSSDKIMDDIRYLASPELKGRGIGSAELDEAATYIKEAFEKAGLQAGGNEGGYMQSWVHDFGDKGKMNLSNVIGYIPGSDEKYKNEPVVISAHYDHLGTGWPDVHAGDEGKIHFGADDNASGVAIMIELARNMTKTAKPTRPIYFVAFTAEEAGLVGSRYFVKEWVDKNGGAKPFANLNLDTNGRLFDKPLLVLNGNTAREWKFIFMGTEYVTGVKTELVQQQLDASDQVAFNEVDVPGIQLFSGAHTDYHRPGDQIEKLDPAGMVKIATVSKEVLQYLADRTDPMPYTGVNKANEDKKAEDMAQKSKRRASTGSMPDFGYAGVGVRIGAVTQDSPADKAGLKNGDIIIAFAGKPVNNLREYSNALKTKSPGDKVKLEVMRGEELLDVELVLGAR